MRDDSPCRNSCEFRYLAGIAFDRQEEYTEIAAPCKTHQQETTKLVPSGDEREAIRLDQFLKRQGAAGTGGQAKLLIQDGQVSVNGEVETRRGRKLRPSDVVTVGGEEWIVGAD